MKEDTCEHYDCLYPGEPFDESIYKLQRTEHHIDGNHGNNDPKNLIWMHFGCHTSLHSTGKKHPMYGKRGRDTPFYGEHHSEESKRKISIAVTGEKHPMYGKHHSEESKKKISEAHAGKHLSEEHRKKISDALTGRHLSEEAKRKMSLAVTGDKNPMCGKRQSEEHKARNVLSHKIGKENYAEIEEDLIWDGKGLVNIDEIMEEIMRND